MLKPVSLTVSGFRSFKDEATFSFTNGDFILINGFRVDSETSSGTGKSSVLMAMAFVLGICDLPATELKNRDSKSIYIKLVLSDGKNTYEAIRDPKLSLIINGELYTGTSVGAEEKLSEILKSPPELVKSLVYRPQKSQGVFLGSSDSYRKEFLSIMLGLSKIDEAYEEYKITFNNLTYKINSNNNELNIIQNMSQGDDYSDEEIELAKQEFDKAVIDANSVNIDEQKQNITNEISHVRVELQRIEFAIRESQKAQNENANIKQQVVNIQKEVGKLKEQQCPTCLREWSNSQALLEQKEQHIQSLMHKFKSNMTIIQSAEPMVQTKPMMENRLYSLNQQMGELIKPVEALHQNLQATKFKYMSLLDKKIKKTKAIEKINEKTQENEKLTKELEVAQHCMSVLSKTGFMGSIFDEVLKDIESRINDLLPHIPNVDTFTVKFQSDQETKSGKINKKIDIFLYKDGVKISLKSLSGGQRTSLDLCTDLAVSEAIRARFGSNLGWVCLDEAMDGLDVQTKQSVLDIIRKKIKGLVIVVDHSTEIKESFDCCFNIKFDGRYSYVA